MDKPTKYLERRVKMNEKGSILFNDNDDLLLHPWGRHPLRVLVQSGYGSGHVVEGLREVVVLHRHVEPVAVPELHTLAGLQHRPELLVLRK